MYARSDHKERSKCSVLVAAAGALVVLSLTLHYLFTPYADASSEGLSTRLSSLVSSSSTSEGTSATTNISTCSVDASFARAYGAHNVKLSRVHEGSGYRVQQVLKKAAEGEAIKIAVVGGSVSNGHGMLNGTRYVYGAIKEIWHSFVSTWIDEIYGQQTFINGAKAATDSTVFEYCWAQLIKLEEKAPDLVFVELDVNDVNDLVTRDATETMLRSILSLPNRPAVIFVGAFALVSQSGRGGMENGGDGHIILSSFYDVPQISVRGALLPALLHNASLADPYFNGDPRHIAQPVHRFLGDMIIAYLQEQRCAAMNEDASEVPASDIWPAAFELGAVPPRRLNDNWDAKTIHPSAPPTCRLAGTEDDSLASVRQDSSWAFFSWKGEKSYIQTNRAGREIEFEVTVRENGQGTIAMGFLRSNSPKYKLGLLKCTTGNQEAVLDGFWERKASLTETKVVARNLEPGVHRLVCRTAAGRRPDYTSFRIAAVMSS
ncbi:hypothetical protein JCM6882_006443 [Rhodosporidiobolus microsporus]